VPKKTGRESIIAPYVYKVQGSEVLMSSLVAPIFNKDKAFMGIAGIDITLTRIQEIAAAAVLFKTGTLTVFSADGKVAGAKDLALIGGPGTGIGIGASFMEKFGKGESFSFERNDARGRRILSIGVPFTIGKTQAWWAVVADIPIAEVLGPVTALIVLIVAVGVLAVLIMGGALLLISRSLSRPLAHGVAFAKRIAAGDLVATLDAAGRGDEIGHPVRRAGGASYPCVNGKAAGCRDARGTRWS
jgi:methyl-accepting chemotaxis protein